MTLRWPNQTTKELVAFYGNPDGDYNGQPDPRWEAACLTYILPPYPMYWSWSQQPVRQLRVHHKCAISLERILARIGQEISRSELKALQLDQCGGTYNFRTMRGLNSLSVHSYGAAIDLAPVANPLGKKWRPDAGMMPLSVVAMFEEEGWTWGGDWNANGNVNDQVRHDAMHFQAARV